jgi:3-hydroxyacyl-[acyl-carrier-protein] dehydratase
MRFLFVDEIVELTPGRHIRAVKHIGADEPYFRDHFPGFPVVPGVLLTEMMAQAAGKCLDAERRLRGKAMLAQIRKASFRRWVSPGVTAGIEADVTASRDQYGTAAAHVDVEGVRICSAELLFSFLPVAQLAAGYRDAVLEDYLDRVTPC